MRGSVLLLGGDPGIGKSTLLLEVAAALARAGHRAVYISGEEAVAQVRMRAERLKLQEAQRLGIPVIATKGCAFAQPAFEGGWGVEIADYSSEGVARAALAALGRLDELSAHAAIAARQAGDTLDAILGETVDAVRARASSRLVGRVKRFIGRNFRLRPFAIPDA